MPRPGETSQLYAPRCQFFYRSHSRLSPWAACNVSTYSPIKPTVMVNIRSPGFNPGVATSECQNRNAADRQTHHPGRHLLWLATRWADARKYLESDPRRLILSGGPAVHSNLSHGISPSGPDLAGRSWYRRLQTCHERRRRRTQRRLPSRIELNSTRCYPVLGDRRLQTEDGGIA